MSHTHPPKVQQQPIVNSRTFNCLASHQNGDMTEQKSVTNKDSDEKNEKKPRLSLVRGVITQLGAGLHTRSLSLLILGLIAMLSAC
ncbi:hypothetical protein CICLE_v10018186mg [Citrus x clementina]|uniref:Uncharacterized protein n=1 Tax=Citrus clementina TaxID=85681 RepID=V4U6U2_CITCL|nr:hypothetical protein CICLE_v10018186mg [Citrus x clementina]